MTGAVGVVIWRSEAASAGEAGGGKVDRLQAATANTKLVNRNANRLVNMALANGAFIEAHCDTMPHARHVAMTPIWMTIGGS